MTTYREALETGLREPLPSDPRERAQEKAVRALVRGGLDGSLSWSEVYHAVSLIEGHVPTALVDSVQRAYDALKLEAAEQQEDDVRDHPRPDLSEEERVGLEGLAQTDYRMTVEAMEAREAREMELEMDC